MLQSPVQLSLKELPTEKALDEARGEIQDKLSQGGSRLANLNWKIMRNAAGGALQDALSKLDLMDYLAGAWCTATELRDIARKTRAAPGTEDTVALAEHAPSVTLHPVVKIKCGPVELPALTFEVKLGAAVECAVLVVAEGKLAGIETGSFKPFAQLFYNKREINKLSGKEVSITSRYKFPNGGISIPCGGEDAEGDWTKL